MKVWGFKVYLHNLLMGPLWLSNYLIHLSKLDKHKSAQSAVAGEIQWPPTKMGVARTHSRSTPQTSCTTFAWYMSDNCKKQAHSSCVMNICWLD